MIMTNMFEFDADGARKVEAVYTTADVVRGDAVSGDHVAHEHRRGQQRSIDGKRVILLHAHGSRVAHQITAGRVRRPGTHPTLAEA
jgi:hypothetical protein